MFDLGWQEFLMVAVVLVLVVGPKDMPRIMRSFSQVMRKAKSMAREFTTSLEDVANEADVKKILQDVKEGEFDDMANLLDGDIKDVANDMKDAAGVDDIKRDVERVQGKEAKPKASAKKAAAKPKSAKKTSAKKTSAKKTSAKKSAKKAATKSAKKAAS